MQNRGWFGLGRPLSLDIGVLTASLASLAGAGCGEAYEVREDEGAIAARQQGLASVLAPNLGFPEYDTSVSVPYAWFASATAEEVSAKVADGYRLHALDVVSVSPLRFTANFVLNQGAFARTGNGWSHDLTEAQLLQIYDDDEHRRIVEIAQYLVNDQWRYAAVWVSNEGSQQRNYKLVLNVTRPTFQAEAEGYRVVSMEPGPRTTCSPNCIGFDTWSGVMIAADSIDQRWQSFGTGSLMELKEALLESSAACANTLNTSNTCQRLALIEEMGPDSYYYVTEEAYEVAELSNGVRILSEGEQTWWASNVFYEAGNYDHPDSFDHLVRRFGARPMRAVPYQTSEGTRYIVTFAYNAAPPMSGASSGTDDVFEEIDAMAARQLRRSGAPGVVLGVARDGHLVHAKGYGYSDVGAERVVEPTDLFKIASTSKVITKAALIRAISGRVSVRDGQPLTLDSKPWGDAWGYVEQPWQPNLGDVSFRDIVTHRTGLRFISGKFCGCADLPLAERPVGCDASRDFEPCNPFDILVSQPELWASFEDNMGPDSFYHHNYETGEYFAPACPASYSPAMGDPPCAGYPEIYRNGTYQMLGTIISALTGMSYNDYVRTQFLDPLGLDRVRISKWQGEVLAGCTQESFPEPLFQALHYQTPEPFREGSAWNEVADWEWLCSPTQYPSSSFSASPIDLLRFATSLDGTTPGYGGLTSTEWAAMQSVGGIYGNGLFRFSAVSEMGELSVELVAATATTPAVMANIKFMYAFNSAHVDHHDFGQELRNVLTAGASQLTGTDLFTTWQVAQSVFPAVACDQSAPFGSMRAVFPPEILAEGIALSSNELSAIVSRNAGSGYDLYLTTRESLAEEFGEFTVLANVNSASDERSPWLSRDGLRLYFSRSSNVDHSGDIFVATRTSVANEFGTPVLVPTPVNHADSDEDPFLSWNEQQLFFASERTNGNSMDLYVSNKVNGAFATPTLLPTVNFTGYEDKKPILTPDGLTLYFKSRRQGLGADTDGDIWMAQRGSTSDNFGEPSNVALLNTSGTDIPVAVSSDGCALYVASNRETGLGGVLDYRLYRAQRQPTPDQVTVTLNIVGTGNVTTAPYNCTSSGGTCSAQRQFGSDLIIFGNRQAYWSDSCIPNGSPGLSTDGVLNFEVDTTCTITFP